MRHPFFLLAIIAALCAHGADRDRKANAMAKAFGGLNEYAQKVMVDRQVQSKLSEEAKSIKEALVSTPGFSQYYEVKIYRWLDTPERWSAGPLLVGSGKSAVEAFETHQRTGWIGPIDRPTKRTPDKLTGEKGKWQDDPTFSLLPDESYILQASLKGNDVVFNRVNWADCMNALARRAKERGDGK